jgi:hypothetical protein
MEWYLINHRAYFIVLGLLVMNASDVSVWFLLHSDYT